MKSSASGLLRLLLPTLSAWLPRDLLPAATVLLAPDSDWLRLLLVAERRVLAAAGGMLMSLGEGLFHSATRRGSSAAGRVRMTTSADLSWSS